MRLLDTLSILLKLSLSFFIATTYYKLYKTGIEDSLTNTIFSDFMLKESNLQKKILLGNSRVIFNNLQNRFFMIRKEKKRLIIKRSGIKNLFENSELKSVRFYNYLQIHSKKNIKIKISDKKNKMTVFCENFKYEIIEIEKKEEEKEGEKKIEDCFILKSKTNFFKVKNLTKIDKYFYLKKRILSKEISRKFPNENILFVQKINKLIFFAVISKKRLNIIVLNIAKGVAKLIIDCIFLTNRPLIDYYKVNYQSNILGIKIKYNSINKYYLIFIPRHDIYFFKNGVIKNSVLITNYKNIKKEDFSSTKIYFLKEEIVILKFSIYYDNTPKINFMKMQLDIKHKRPHFKNSEIRLVKHIDYRVGILNLLRNDKRGFFKKKGHFKYSSYYTVHNYFYIKDKKSFEYMVCSIIIQGRVICYKLFNRSKYAQYTQYPYDVFLNAFMKSFFILLGFLSVLKIFFILKKKLRR